MRDNTTCPSSKKVDFSPSLKQIDTGARVITNQDGLMDYSLGIRLRRSVGHTFWDVYRKLSRICVMLVTTCEGLKDDYHTKRASHVQIFTQLVQAHFKKRNRVSPYTSAQLGREIQNLYRLSVRKIVRHLLSLFERFNLSHFNVLQHQQRQESEYIASDTKYARLPMFTHTLKK